MANEKIMILEMVKDGKITVDEGVKLLNAIKQPTNSNFDDFTTDLKYKFQNIPKPDKEKIKKNAQCFFNKTEELFDDFTKSVKDFLGTNSTQDVIQNTQSSENQPSSNVINIEDLNNQNDNDNQQNNN